MRISDRLRLAGKTLERRWAVLPAAGFAVAVFCLCFAGAILESVRQEKVAPYELTVIAQGSAPLTDGDAAALSQIEDVTAATAVLEVRATVKTGGDAAELTLTGMDGGYIEGVYARGGAYPADTVMPYIVLNEAACKAFSADAQEAPAIDWLNAGWTVRTGEGTRPVTARVCGLLAAGGDGETEEPAAYISLGAAKALAAQNGYASLRARVTDIGCAQRAANAAAALGLGVANSADELQAGWDMRMKEMTYLLVLGGFCLLCAAALTGAGRAVLLRRNACALEAMRWLGMKRRDFSRLFTLHALIICVAGLAAGILASLSLPSFLSGEPAGSSVFMLAAPFPAVMAGMAVCLAAGVLPACVAKRG